MVDMESSGSIDRDDFEEANSESNEVYKQELEAQMENIDIDNGDVRPRFLKPKTILLIVGGIILLALATVAVVLLINRIDGKSETAKVENVQKLANRYAHYIVDGNKDDDSDIDGVKEIDGSLYLEKVLDSDTKKNEREDFTNSIKGISKELNNALKETKSSRNSGFDNYYYDLLGTNEAKVDIINNHLNFDYDLNKFVTVYLEGGDVAILKTFEDSYSDLKQAKERVDAIYEKDDVDVEMEDGNSNAVEEDEGESDEEDNTDGDSNDETGDVTYSSDISETDEEKRIFYNLVMSYEEKLVTLLNLYQLNGCLVDGSLNENCYLSQDAANSISIFRTLMNDDMQSIKENLEAYKSDVVVQAQWIALNIKNEGLENEEE